MTFDECNQIVQEHALRFNFRAVFKFDNAKRRYGVCKYPTWKEPRNVISVNGVYAATASHADVMDTLLHEIAHAIAGFAAAHGPEWKRVAVMLGAKPVACGEIISGAFRQHVEASARFRATCGCGKHFYKLRKPRSVRVCRACKSTLQWTANDGPKPEVTIFHFSRKRIRSNETTIPMYERGL